MVGCGKLDSLFIASDEACSCFLTLQKALENGDDADTIALHVLWLQRTLQAALILTSYSNVMTKRLPPLVNFVRLASVFVVGAL